MFSHVAWSCCLVIVFGYDTNVIANSLPIGSHVKGHYIHHHVHSLAFYECIMQIHLYLCTHCTYPTCIFCCIHSLKYFCDIIRFPLSFLLLWFPRVVSFPTNQGEASQVECFSSCHWFVAQMREHHFQLCIDYICRTPNVLLSVFHSVWAEWSVRFIAYNN